MVQIISPADATRLGALYQFERYTYGKYKYDIENRNTKYILETIFKGHRDRLRVLNIIFSFYGLVARKFATYVGNPKNELNIDITNPIITFISQGAGILVCSSENGEFKVRVGKPDGYVIEQDGTETLYTRYIEKDLSQQKFVNYILKQNYTPTGRTNTLYEVKEGFLVKNGLLFGVDGVHGDKIDLSRLSSTQMLQEYEAYTLPKGQSSPLVVVNNFFDEFATYGRSEYEDIEPLVNAVERQTVNFEDQLLKHLEAKMILPASMRPYLNDYFKQKGGIEMRIRDVEAMFLEMGDQIPSYLDNHNSLMDQYFTFTQELLKQACSNVSLPFEFIGLKIQGSAESSESRQYRMSDFLKKIEFIQDRFTDGLMKVYEIAKHWGYDIGEDFIEFPEPMPRSRNEIVDYVSLAYSSGLMSRRRAVQLLQNLNEAETEIELEEILKGDQDVNITQNDFVPNGTTTTRDESE